jgi:hypothetical protein
MIPSFNVGGTRNIQGAAYQQAYPGITASNDQRSALAQLALARMAASQNFTQQGLDLQRQQQELGLKQSQPDILSYASLIPSGISAFNGFRTNHPGMFGDTNYALPVPLPQINLTTPDIPYKY